MELLRLDLHHRFDSFTDIGIFEKVGSLCSSKLLLLCTNLCASGSHADFTRNLSEVEPLATLTSITVAFLPSTPPQASQGCPSLESLRHIQNTAVSQESTTMGFKSWLDIPKSSHFSLANLPFGIISAPNSPKPRAAVAIGDQCLDLKAFQGQNGFSACSQDVGDVFAQPTLNPFAALGRPAHRAVRKYIQDIFREDTPHASILKDNQEAQKACLLRQDQVKMHLPMQIGDYTDFYAGKNHAYNLGCILRGPKNALQPNYTHLPVGYHGRASSVVVSGTPVVRPNGQVLEDPKAEVKKPVFKPCQRLDVEVELGAFLCQGNQMGQPIPISEAEDSIFGIVLLNDWSARDIQAWEYVPLGPFNAKVSSYPGDFTDRALTPCRTLHQRSRLGLC